MKWPISCDMDHVFELKMGSFLLGTKERPPLKLEEEMLLNLLPAPTFRAPTNHKWRDYFFSMHVLQLAEAKT